MDQSLIIRAAAILIGAIAFSVAYAFDAPWHSVLFCGLASYLLARYVGGAIEHRRQRKQFIVELSRSSKGHDRQARL